VAAGPKHYRAGVTIGDGARLGVYYGTDLVDYIHQEFGGPGLAKTDPGRNPQATVAFWKEFL